MKKTACTPENSSALIKKAVKKNSKYLVGLVFLSVITAGISVINPVFYKKIIDDCKGFPEKIKVLRLYKEGEPLVNKRLPEMIEYATKSGMFETIDFTTNDGFDLILADPPYDDYDLAGVEYLAGFLKSGGIMVLSHPDATPEISELKLLETRKYAAAHLSVYVKI